MKQSDDNPLTRPGPAHPDITDPDIAKLVATFYARAREDEILGPVFNRAVHDWDEHIAQITDFWSSIMLRTFSSLMLGSTFISNVPRADSVFDGSTTTVSLICFQRLGSPLRVCDRNMPWTLAATPAQSSRTQHQPSSRRAS